MKRFTASLPDSVPELCLLRLGLRSRGLRAGLYGLKIGRAIAASAREAIAADAGLLASETFLVSRGHFGVLQYWRSFEALETWSHRPPHSEWWRQALERMRTRGDFGVYHETFLVPRDRIESIYLNCDPVGLSTFGPTAEPQGADANSRGRLGKPLKQG